MPGASSVQPGSWVLSTNPLDSSGRAFNAATIKACQGSEPTQACQAALGRLHLRDLITYQPASRFWPLQRDETAIFLGPRWHPGPSLRSLFLFRTDTPGRTWSA
jgi:hypothetical protein